eukprot:5624370-Amphidinium_carterae.1
MMGRLLLRVTCCAKHACPLDLVEAQAAIQEGLDIPAGVPPKNLERNSSPAERLHLQVNGTKLLRTQLWGTYP